jgi:hypothetical protein
MSKIAAVGGEIAQGIISRACVVRGMRIMIVASRQIQVRSFASGLYLLGLRELI